MSQLHSTPRGEDRPEYLGSWSGDWATTTAAEQSTDQVPTLDTIRQVMREFEEKWKGVDLGPDVWVLTHDEWMKLRLHCERRDHPDIRNGIAGYAFLEGIRVEEVATKEQVLERVKELARKGVKAGYLKESE